MVDLKRVVKTYGTGDTLVRALDGVDLRVEKGEFLAITGSSGSGKSTLLNVVGLLTGFDQGSYLLGGMDVGDLTPSQAARIRLTTLGFVFQSFNLLDHLSALENVELPLGYMGVAAGARRRRAEAVLDRVGLSHRLRNRPAELSGGEQQRVAVARALVNSPSLILADEPTGNLDSATAQSIMDLFVELNRDGSTIFLVTHNEALIPGVARVITLRDGKIATNMGGQTSWHTEGRGSRAN